MTVVKSNSKMSPTTWLECYVSDSVMELPVDHQRSFLLDLPAQEEPLNVKLLLRDSDLLPSVLKSWCVKKQSATLV